MTENEYKKINNNIKFVNWGKSAKMPLQDLAKILQEFEEYRAIGTVEEFKALKSENAELHCELQAINATMGLYEQEIRAKAIDEFAELLKGNLVSKYANANLTQQYVALQVTDWCNEIAEQMKEGAE